MAIFFQLIFAIALIVLSIILAPKPAKNKPEAVTDFERPTADLNRPIPVLFGCVTVKGANTVAAMDIGHTTHKITA